MKRRRKQQTGEKDDNTEETHHSEDRVRHPARASLSHDSRNDSSSHHQPRAAASGSMAASASLSSSSVAGTLPDSGQDQPWELEHRRKASRKSSMRHQARKRIETEHLAELQAKLETINTQLREENESLRALIKRLREPENSNPVQANSTSTRPMALNTAATTGQLNVEQQRSTNDLLSLLQRPSQYNVLDQRQPVLPGVSAAATPSRPTTMEQTRSLQLALIQQRFNSMPLAYQQDQHLYFPLVQELHLATLQPGSLPYIAGGLSSRRILPSILDLPNNNYGMLHQQAAFGARMSPEDEEEDSKPKSQDRG
ncbi:unnamed protein product [Cylindrotheca closterium]|uniref:BZIP domain-containing protein n=1 Tax=Cylindrotheca closterium TaxID=2856 RepID=A0AAD2PU98_9STRA|nr:unnamed protein product [Cylindrotheca closterium]